MHLGTVVIPYLVATQGEYIDWTLGLTLGISTMAAAGLGNMISDLAGLGLADQVPMLITLPYAGTECYAVFSIGGGILPASGHP